MKCYTLSQGVLRPGIQLWQDDPSKCFVHLRPDLWMPVRADLLNCADPSQVERVGKEIVIHRASVIGGSMEFIPEVSDSAGNACVLAHIDNSIVSYTPQVPPLAEGSYRTAMGLNFYAWPIGTRRITMGADNTKLACEEYGIVVGMKPGDYVNLHVIFQPADPRAHGTIDPWVEGTFLRYDGVEPTYHQLVARTQAERFRGR